MSAAILDELVRIVAYGAGGFLLGCLFSVWVADRHRVITEVLDEAERDVPTKRKRMSGDTLQSVIVIGLMVMMFLTAIVWLQSDQENAEQDKRECIRAAAVTQALRQRTANYLESATSEQELWRNLRAQLVLMGGKPESPLIRSIDRHLRDQRVYLDHLRDNPVPRGSAKDC